MAHLAKTGKFKVWSTPSTEEGSVFVNELNRNPSSLVVVGGRKVTVEDVASVAVLMYSVSLDQSTIDKIDTDLASAKSKIGFSHPELSAATQIDSAVYNIILNRAALFVRIVSLMVCRSGVRSEVVECLVEMLHSNVIPNFSSPELAGLELCACLTGAASSCFCDGVLMSSASAFAEADITPIGLTDSEFTTLKLGQFFSTGCICLIASGAANLGSMIDCVSALSCDTFGISIEPFDAVHFDVCRPHRGQIASATNLRLLLEGSKRVKNAHAEPSFTDLVFGNIPQVHGPSLESIASLVKSLEIELNSSESGPIDSTRSGFDPAQSLLALRQLTSCLALLLTSSNRRSSALQHLKNNVPCISYDVSNEVKNILPSQFASSNEFEVSLHILRSLSKSLAAEVKNSLEHLQNVEGISEQTAGDDSTTGGVSERGGKEGKEGGKDLKPALDESNLSADQKAKAEAKRKQKADKAAQKNAAKEAKKGDSSGRSVVVLGVGSTSIRQAVLARTSKGPCDGAYQNVTDPFDVSEEGFSAFCVKLLEQLSSGGEKRRPKIPKGTRDFGPEQMRIREQVFAAIRRIFKRHGGVEIDTPVFELKEVLTGKYGEDSKLIYDLADQGGELLSLRYDLTVPFARFLAMSSVGNIKRYHIAKVYRRDQPQLNRGRFREFYQCDFDIAGSYSVMVPDAEVITVASEILSELPVGKFLIKLNHRKLLDAIFEICGVPAEKFRPICSAVDKLDKAPWTEVRTEMVTDKGLAPEVADKIGEFVLQSGPPKDLWKILTDKATFGDHVGANAAMSDLHALFGYLEAMGSLPHVSFDLSLARGLDYYTGVIYEVVLVDGTAQVGSIAAGGRYDNLVGMFSPSGIQTPCVGVSIGIERVFTIIERKAEELKIAQSSPIQVFIASIGSNLISERMKVAKLLWNANIPAEYSHQDNPKFKKQLDETLERGIPFMVVFGEDEMAKGMVKLKNMKLHTEFEISLDTLVDSLLKDDCTVIPPGTDLGFLSSMRESYV